MKENKGCCFLGHRKIDITCEMRKKLHNIVEKMIVNDNIDTFFFGSKSEFDEFCYDVVSNLKIKYPHIKRIYVRAQFPVISDDYRDYLLQTYEHTYYPENIINSGKASYVERNFEMINRSKICIMYFDKNYNSSYKGKSGTKIAYDYAFKRGKRIINIFEM